jgi:hypothetical protein
VAAGLIVGGRTAGAQMHGVPVLQNAFLNPGTTLGANYGTGERGQVFGAAAAWVPSSGVLQLSGGGAWFDSDTGTSHATLGLRAMAPIRRLGSRTLGVAVFAGVGGMSIGHRATETRIPVGASVGYRRALGASRGISAYVAPFLSISRVKQDTVGMTRVLFRVSVGVDAAVLPGLGLTIGYEGGAHARAGTPGPSGGLFGIGISYALRRSH